MGKKISIEVQQLEDGFVAKIQTGPFKSSKVSSDTLQNLLIKIIKRIKFEGHPIFTKDILEEEK